jgi:4-carboxymuconolactone decarboxylase
MKKMYLLSVIVLSLSLSVCAKGTEGSGSESFTGDTVTLKENKNMIRETINFTEDGRVNLRTYIHDEPSNGGQTVRRPAIIVLPGGAYGFLSEQEGEPVALTFYQKDFNTFVLKYSVGDYSIYPNPLDEISRAIWEVRRNADEWGIIPDAITVMGFSAGAGVAGLSATQWNTPGLAERLGIPKGKNKPDAAVLGYGAASNSVLLDYPGQMIPDILGKIAKDRTPQLDLANYVGTHTPPLFIWNTRYDKFVPQEAAPVLWSTETGVGLWVPLCVSWLNNLFKVQNDMEVLSLGESAAIFPQGTKSTLREHTGTVYISSLKYTGNQSITHFVFEAGSRNWWHFHPDAGQTLLVLGGEGYYQEKGKPVRVVRQGDVVVTPANVRHWNGATPKSAIECITVSEQSDKEHVKWLRIVTDEEFNREYKK